MVAKHVFGEVSFKSESFFIVWVAFLLLKFYISLHTPGRDPTLDTSFANIFL